ncbi:hypothetical protein HAX54_027638 [Datura stramonium]|uniref:Uncharacterized protein n=1 Tax=Datura stramonium TaxID=4076 RepID=A0ABS8V5C7_DATST|nr:hypothetical protein [Datura stramonium]
MGRGRPRKIRPREELQLDVRNKGNKAKDTGSSGSGKVKRSISMELETATVQLENSVPLVLNSPVSIGPELSKEGGHSVNGVQGEKGEDIVQHKLDLQEQKVETKWGTLFTGTRLTNRGRDLSFVAPTIADGRKVVQLLDIEVERENEKWRKAVILCSTKEKIVPTKKPSMEKVWQKKEPQIKKPEDQVNLQSQVEFPCLTKSPERWREAKGKSAAKSRNMIQTIRDVTILNGFSMLAESSQKAVDSQVGNSKDGGDVQESIFLND